MGCDPYPVGNGCGSCGGVYTCSGCSIATPSNYGASCGNCGGTITCSGSCSTPAPVGLCASCTANCQCASGTCDNSGRCASTTPPTSLSVTPTTVVAACGAVNVNWTNRECPVSTDWFTVAPNGSANTTYTSWQPASPASASGGMSVAFSTTTVAGSYQVRLWETNNWWKLAFSNSFSVIDSYNNCSTACTANCQCTSGNCNGGFCIPAGTTTYNSACNSAPNCVGTTASGTMQCSAGTFKCSATTPVDPARQANCAACTANCQCTSDNCSGGFCTPAGKIYNGLCNSSPSCTGAISTGTLQCIGGVGGTFQCTATTPTNPTPQANCAACTYNCDCTSNNCSGNHCIPSGQTYNSSCTSNASCTGATSSGTMQCNTSNVWQCSATTPNNPTPQAECAACTSNCQCTSNNCNGGHCIPVASVYNSTCTSSPNCAGTISSGTVQCLGGAFTCSASVPNAPPPLADCSGCTANCQCSSGSCVSGICAPVTTAACGSCGGAMRCDGNCSFPTPANLGAPCGNCGGVIACDFSCSIPSPANYGASCGSCGGRIKCDGTCTTATPVNFGLPCGSCGGKIKCDGNCSAATPNDLGADCGHCGGKVLCDASCSVPTPANYGAACAASANACSSTNAGTVGCDGICASLTPTDNGLCGHITAAESTTKNLQNVVVELRNAQGRVLQTTRTNSSGIYNFTTTPPNSYVTPAVDRNQAALPEQQGPLAPGSSADFIVRGTPTTLQVTGKAGSLVTVTSGSRKYSATIGSSGSIDLSVAAGPYTLSCSVPTKCANKIVNLPSSIVDVGQLIPQEIPPAAACPVPACP